MTFTMIRRCTCDVWACGIHGRADEAAADADRLAAALRDWHDAALLRDWHDDDGMDGCSAVAALAAHDERRAT